MIDGNKLASVGFNYIGRPYSEMDCQKFIERCLSDCGWNIDLTGSNAWYRYCMKNGWVGTPEECKAKYGTIPPGAMLFILEPVSASTPEKYKHDGVGDATHIGLDTGKGQGAIHSSKSRGGVCESKFSGKSIKGGWNRVGLLPKDIDYHMQGGDQPVPEPKPVIPDTPDDKFPMQMCVVPSTVNYRSVPDQSKGYLGKISGGTILTVVGQQNNWSIVDWGGKNVYIMTQFLAPYEPEEPDMLLQISRKKLMAVYEKIEGVCDDLGNLLGLRG